MTVKILNDKQKYEIAVKRNAGTTLSSLASLYSVSSDTISRVLKEFSSVTVETPVMPSTPQVRVIELHNGKVDTFISHINKAINERILFSIDISFASDNAIWSAQQDIYDLYLETENDSDSEQILDTIDDWLRSYSSDPDSQEYTAEEIREVVFGEVQGFKNESQTTKSILSPLTPSQQDEKAYSDAIKATPKAPELIWNASSKFISITEGRQTFNADRDHPGFQKALQLLAAGDTYGALDIINVEKAITRFVDGDIRIEDGTLFFKDIELKTGLTDRIIQLMNDGKDFKFLLPFLNNLMLNPSRKAVYRLFDFLEANDIEITKEGYFIAWKKVGKDYKDLYTGTMDNSPGKTLSVERNQVDEDDNRTCSHGLHVCSKSYLGSYGVSYGNKIVSVLVHPKDVVSIPIDYNNAKMRTTGYKVIEDVTGKF